jgi:WD40 repeat protein
VADVWNRTLALSADGRRLVTGGEYGGEPMVWDVDRGEVLTVLRSGASGCSGAAFSPDGRYVAAALRGAASLRVWDLRTGEQVLRRDMHAVCPAFSPDGTRLAVVDTYNTQVLECDFANRVPFRKIGGGWWWMAYRHDSKAIASTGEGKPAILNVATGRTLCTLSVERQFPQLAFSPDGRQLAALQADGQGVLLFDATTGRQVREVKGRLGIHSVAFSPDGRWLLTGLGNTAVVAWAWE